MNEATIALTITTFAVFLIFAGLFIWGWVSGQFKDIESAKFKMLERYYDKEKSKGEDKSA